MIEKRVAVARNDMGSRKKCENDLEALTKKGKQRLFLLRDRGTLKIYSPWH